MAGINRVMLLGRVAQNPLPKLSRTGVGTPTLNFSCVTTEARADSFESHWHPVVAFGNPAERAGPLVVPGADVLVYGKLWQRKDASGQIRTEIIADQVRILVTPPKRERAGGETGGRS